MEQTRVLSGELVLVLLSYFSISQAFYIEISSIFPFRECLEKAEYTGLLLFLFVKSVVNGFLAVVLFCSHPPFLSNI